MGTVIYGITKGKKGQRVARLDITRDGIEISDRDDTRVYNVDPLEAGEAAVLALAEQCSRDSFTWVAKDRGGFLRAYWYVRRPDPGAINVLFESLIDGSLEDKEKARKAIDRLAKRFGVRPAYCLSEEFVGNSDQGSIWFLDYLNLIHLIRESSSLARQLLAEEKLRLVGGLGIVPSEEKSGLGITCGSTGIHVLEIDTVRALRSYLMRVLQYEIPVRGIKEGPLRVYIEGRDVRGQSLWDYGIFFELAGRRVKLSPREVARLLVLLVREEV